MPGYKSNAKSVLGPLLKQLNGVETKLLDNITRTIAADLIASNISRIHNEGKAVDGSLIDNTNSNTVVGHRNNKTGKTFSKRKKTTTRVLIRTPYSQGYAKKRLKKGRRIDKVDLSFTGKLSKEFSFAASGLHSVGVGFLTSYGSNLSDAHEERYNKKIWGVTQEDERVAQEVAKNKVNKHFNG